MRRSPRLLAILATTSLAAATLAVAAPRPDATPIAAAPRQGPIRYRDPVFERVNMTPGIVYGTATDIPSGNRVDLKLDWYEAVGDTEPERPVMVFIHGGGFVSGDRSHGRRYAEEFARRGYVAVSISYRLNQGNLYTVGIPAAVSDARQAVRWVRDQAQERRVDTRRITIGGSSAGAITALFLTYTEVERETGGTSSSTAAVMDLWGGLYTYINELTAGEPPLVIIHGTEDTVVPFQQAVDLKARAEAVGVPFSYHPLAGVGHGSPNVAEHVKWTAEFFYQQLWPDGPDLPTATPEPPTPTLEPPTPTPGSPTAPAPSATPTAGGEGIGALFLPWASKGAEGVSSAPPLRRVPGP